MWPHAAFPEMEKIMIDNTDFNEVNFTFYLAVRYGLMPETASFIMDNAGKMERLEKYVLDKVNKFFTDPEKYGIALQLLTLKEKRQPVPKELKNRIKRNDLWYQKNKFENAYAEFKGLIELELLSSDAHPLLEGFLTSYGEISDEAKTSRVKELYDKYINKSITKNKLEKEAHMSLKRVIELISL